MSHYEDICAAYAKARGDWEAHRQSCRDFVLDLTAKLAADLGAERDNFVFLSPNTEYHPREVRPIETALEYGADGAFHLGFGLRVRAAADHEFSEVLLTQFSVARNPGGYELRMQHLNDPIRFPLDYQEVGKGHRALFDNFIKRAISTFAEHDLRYIELAENSRTLLR